MRKEAVVCLFLFVGIGLVTSDDKFDLKSVLLQIMNKVKTKTDSLTGIKMAESQDTSNGPGGNFEKSEEYPNDLNDESDVFRTAIERLNAEIRRLHATYINELQNEEDLDQSLDVGTDEQYDGDSNDMLFRKMQKVAYRLHLLRVKLEKEFGIDDDSTRLSGGKPYEVSEPKWKSAKQGESASVWLKKVIVALNRLQNKKAEITDEGLEAELGLNLDAFKHNNDHTYGGNTEVKKPVQGELLKQKTDGDSERTYLQERDWHSRRCAPFMERCLGWYANCCDDHEMKIGGKVHMCCSFQNAKTNGIEGAYGICLPNAFGKHTCD